MTPDAAVAELPAAEATDEEPVDIGAADMAAHAELLAQINPCPLCGQMQNAGPGGEDHNFPHCWKCGYRPGGATPPGAVLGAVTPGLTAAQVDSIVAELRKGIVADLVAMGATVPEGARVAIEGADAPAADAAAPAGGEGA